MRLAALALLLAPSLAYAQDPTVGTQPAFEVDRLGPGLAVVDDALAEPYALVGRLSLSYLDRPLVVRDVRDGGELSVPVAGRLGGELELGLGLSTSWQVGLTLPFVVYQRGDRLRGLDLDEAGLRATTPGDLRLLARYVFAPGVGVAFALGLPTGDDQHFAGEAATWAEFRLILAHRTRWVRLAANAGPRFRGEEVDFLSPEVTLGNELTYGLLAETRVVRDVHAFVEVAGVRGDHGVSPVEARLGGRLSASTAWSIALFAGAAVSGDDDPGAGRFRLGLELGWQQAPRADEDDDGVPDRRDRCVDQAEDLDDFEDADGCPDPDDDGDGVMDAVDECPQLAEDVDSFLDDDGCPELDNDKDGALDGDDPCPYDKDDACRPPAEPVRDEDF